MELITHTNLNKIKCLTKSNYFGSFIFLLVFCFSFIVAGEQAKASLITDFEIYDGFVFNESVCHGDVVFYTNPTTRECLDVATTTTTFSYSGNQSIILDGDISSQRLYYDIATTTASSTVCISFIVDSMLANPTIDLWDSGISIINIEEGVNEYNDQFVIFGGNPYYTYTGITITEDTWHKVCVTINTTNDYADIIIDETSFSTRTADKVNFTRISFNNTKDIGIWDFITTESSDMPSDITSYDIYDKNLDIWSPPEDFFDYPVEQICFIDEECWLAYTYNKLIIGNEMLLIDATTSEIFATSTVLDTTLKQNHIQILQDYSNDLRLQTWAFVSGQWALITGHSVHIKWTTLEDLEEEMRKLGILPEENTLCDDIASSSEFFYAFSCGMRMAVHWAFMPSAKSLVSFQATTDNLKNQFPISVGYQFYDLIDNATTSTSSVSLDIPLKWWNGHEYAETGAYLISSTTLMTGLSKQMENGQTLYVYIQDLISKLIFLMVFSYMLLRILGIINPSYGATFDGLGIQSRRKEKAIYKAMEKGRTSNTIDLRATSYGSSHGTEVINLRK